MVVGRWLKEKRLHYWKLVREGVALQSIRYENINVANSDEDHVIKAMTTHPMTHQTTSKVNYTLFISNTFICNIIRLKSAYSLEKATPLG